VKSETHTLSADRAPWQASMREVNRVEKQVVEELTGDLATVKSKKKMKKEACLALQNFSLLRVAVPREDGGGSKRKRNGGGAQNPAF